jgi:hypothetical protein
MSEQRPNIASNLIGLWHRFGDPVGRRQASRKRCQSRSALARPYICRFSSLIRVTWPSTRPDLHGRSTRR